MILKFQLNAKTILFVIRLLSHRASLLHYLENGHSSGYESTNSGEAFRGQSAGHHSNSSSTSQLSTGSHGEDFSNIPNLYENVSSTSSHRGESVRGRASHHPQFNQGRGRGYSTPARGGRGGVGAGGAGQMRRGMGQTRGLGR